jgi:hypothetical protein
VGQSWQSFSGLTRRQNGRDTTETRVAKAVEIDGAGPQAWWPGSSSEVNLALADGGNNLDPGSDQSITRSPIDRD